MNPEGIVLFCLVLVISVVFISVSISMLALFLEGY